MAAELDRADCLGGAHAVWSMWPGYLDAPTGTRLRAWLDTTRSVSPSSTAPGMRRCRPAAPRRGRRRKEVVPIHTRHPHRYAELFANVHERADGEWWAI